MGAQKPLEPVYSKYMGTRNGCLIRETERARKRGDQAVYEAFAAAVEDTQAMCPHNVTRVVRVTAATKKNRESKGARVGDVLTWCRECSKLLLHTRNGKPL